MFRRFHDRFGTAGLVVAVVALVAAIGGTALAAGGLTKQQEKQVKKIAKKYAGKPGAAGPQGPAGSAGPQGPAGANGKDGAAGAKGATGATGKTGNTGSAGAKGATGATGATGFSGFTETLPAEKTETGTYAAVWDETLGPALASITFPIPLSAPIPNSNVKKINVGETVPAECNGGTIANPKALPGFLCIYNGTLSALKINTVFPASGGGGAGTTGAVVRSAEEMIEGGPPFPWFNGSYAVTAP